MPRLTGRRVLVTGAAGGLGQAIVTQLVVQGASVIATDRDQDGLASLQKAAVAGKVITIAADLLLDSAVDDLTESASRTGAIDGLVNCAGIYPVTPLAELSAAEWDQVLGLNLRAPFLLSRAIVPAMRKRGGGIVNISSTASVLARPGIAHYAASKAALNQLTRVLAIELAPFGIRVNAVLPGVIATDRVLASSTSKEAAAEMEAKVVRIPQRRLGEPREVAPLVAFLLSDEASYITGALMAVDGGFSLGIASYTQPAEILP
jgi:NAD(P)-dependent dehydrogenase (short-subunit alcohol dehydrogenase family)